jgi:hypothetical protein
MTANSQMTFPQEHFPDLRRTPTLLRRRIATELSRFVMVAYAVLTVAGFSALYTQYHRAEARRFLVPVFTSVPDTFHEALAIWSRNSLMVSGVMAAIAGIAIVEHLLDEDESHIERVARWSIDLIVGSWALIISAVVGALLGAFGLQQIKAFMPFGPVEALAWVLMLTVYVRSRVKPTVRGVLLGMLAVEMLLLVAALLEIGSPA